MDFNKPVTTDLKTDVLQQIRDLQDALARMDHSGSTNIPAGCIRWSDTNSRLEKWNNSAWEPLLPDASTSQKGLAQLINSATSTSTTLAPTAAALKSVNDAKVNKTGDTMTGNLDMSGNDLNDVGIMRSGSSQEMRAGQWGGKGQIYSNVGGLHIGSDGAGESVVIYTKTSGGTLRAVCKIDEAGNTVFYGNVTFNNGTITP